MVVPVHGKLYASKALYSSSQKGVRGGVWAEQSLAGDRFQRRLKRGVRLPSNLLSWYSYRGNL